MCISRVRITICMCACCYGTFNNTVASGRRTQCAGAADTGMRKAAIRKSKAALFVLYKNIYN